MTLSARDRKILLAIVPVVVLVAYWFLLFSPKREEAATAKVELAEQTERRDAARATMSAARATKTDFAADYGEIVRLGKAIPARVDMPSLLVQLDRAAAGTGIRFTRIATGEREVAATTPAPTTTPPPAGTTPTAAGGEAAQSAPGGAAESANDAAATSDQRNAAAEQSGVNPADAQTSTTSGQGGLPVGGGTATGDPAAAGAAATGLETVPLELEFEGDFFRLADFFHDVKRFVHVVNTDVVVNGRLVTVDSLDLTSDPVLFPRIKASLTATIYLSPKAQGATAGATPQGPATTTPAAAPAPSDGTTPTATPAPTAAATP
jgi:Tfp pilus assembly protein PilO